MIIRIEFTESKSESFRNVLRLCKQFPSFKEFEQEGLHIYSVEFAEDRFDSFLAMRDLMRGWKSPVYFMDNVLVSALKIDRVVYDHQYSRPEANPTRKPLGASMPTSIRVNMDPLLDLAEELSKDPGMPEEAKRALAKKAVDNALILRDEDGNSMGKELA